MVALEIFGDAPRHNMMGPNALRAHVLWVGRLLDKLDFEGMRGVIERVEIALALLPMLKARRDEINLIARLLQQLGKVDITGGALDLAAKLGVDAEDRYASL